ncbi:hypothetical protein HKT54_29920, partial [Pseudomonas aeruginosa]|nr:hypothetical protein [Pseudomonas aeruginosa]
MSPLPASPALNSLLRLLREGAPLVERVGALRRLLLEHPGTRLVDDRTVSLLAFREFPQINKITEN